MPSVKVELKQLEDAVRELVDAVSHRHWDMVEGALHKLRMLYLDLVRGSGPAVEEPKKTIEEGEKRGSVAPAASEL